MVAVVELPVVPSNVPPAEALEKVLLPFAQPIVIPYLLGLTDTVFAFV
jgi:hypothetical protein